MNPADTDSVVLMSEAVDTVPVAEPEAPVAAVTQQPAWHDGLLPVQRPLHTGHDSGFVTLIVMLMLALVFSIKHIRRIRGTLMRQLWITRPRRDYDHLTMSERRTVALMLIATVFLIGLVITAGLALKLPGSCQFTFASTLSVCAWVAGYFAFQYFIYFLIGYTFTTPEGRTLWLQGFTASMSMLGIMLILPGVAVVFYPSVTAPAVVLSMLFYAVSRIIFIYKGFRIFYTNFGSIVYFILYLCTLEIVPITIFVNLSDGTL